MRRTAVSGNLIKTSHILYFMANQKDLGIEIRKEILRKSLLVEKLTSYFLSSLLGIKDYQKSKTLGNSGNCMSFNQKVNLLIEIGALSIETRSKFQKFMEIRNQFMHNFDASTFEKCISEINGAEKYLLNTYPQNDSNSNEEKLKLAVNELSSEIVDLTVAITEKVKEKKKVEATNKALKISTKAFVNTASQLKKDLDDFFEKEIAKSPVIETEKLRKFGTGFHKTFYRRWKQNFDKLKTEQN